MSIDDDTSQLMVAAMQARTDDVSGDPESLSRLLNRLPHQRRLARRAVAVAMLATSVIVTGGVVLGVTEIGNSRSSRPPISSTATSLESLGAPTVSGVCAPGSYQTATGLRPLATISGATLRAGMQLSGAACDTTFTWHVGRQFSAVRATVYLDRADSGPVPFTLRNGQSALAFLANGRTVDQVTVSGTPVRVRVDLRGVDTFSIVLPNHGDDAGVLDLTPGHLAR